LRSPPTEFSPERRKGEQAHGVILSERGHWV
jgi:hypothetical protein